MAARSGSATIGGERRSAIMANEKDFKRQVWRAAIIMLALAACLIFGITVLADSDWVPGGIIVAASTIGLIREVPVIRRLCRTGGGELRSGLTP
jgi:1,4-dihydroxy-2-naphthoate octaprenyltransferase